jgi:hypothetical protein
MPANPQPGAAYRQEYYPPGEALDEARVLNLNGSARVPYGSFNALLVTPSEARSNRRPNRSTTPVGSGRSRSVSSRGITRCFDWSA